MMKIIALNYLLFHDVKVTPDDSNSVNDWCILRAQIDTKLFLCLTRAEKLLYQALQKLIFLNAGRLTRDAIIPVCLVMWLLQTTGLPRKLSVKHKTQDFIWYYALCPSHLASLTR